MTPRKCYFHVLFSSNFFLSFTGNVIDEDDDQCAENEFMCDHDKCILKVQECDGTVDCNDGTDELNCPQHQGLCVEEIDFIFSLVLRSPIGHFLVIIFHLIFFFLN